MCHASCPCACHDPTKHLWLRSFDLAVCPLLARLFAQHRQLLTNIDTALSKESVWAHMARREASANRERFRARCYFGDRRLAPGLLPRAVLLRYAEGREVKQGRGG